MDQNQQSNTTVVSGNSELEFDRYEDAKTRIDKLLDTWSTEVDTVAINNRNLRKIDINVHQLQDEGLIDKDEAFYVARVLDNNIKREKPPYFQYLQQSRRIAIFARLDGGITDTTIEEAFTKGMTYKGWMNPHLKVIDGAQLHGRAAVEVVFDKTKPLNVGIEYIAFEDLIFPLDTITLQTCGWIAIRHKITYNTLKNWSTSPEKGFDPVQCNKILEAKKNNKDENIVIYKIYFKVDGVVYLAWYSKKDTDNWIKAPAMYVSGMQTKEMPQLPVNPLTSVQVGLPPQQPQPTFKDIPATEYPIFQLIYNETEEEKLTEHKGRAFIDKPKQEAHTALACSYLNGALRASAVFCAASDSNGGSLRVIEDFYLEPNRVYSAPCDFFSPPYPSSDLLKGLEYFEGFNEKETGAIGFQVLARDDRKSAREIAEARQESNMIGSVSLGSLSDYIREVYSYVWKIVQNLAINGLIDFMSQRPELLTIRYDLRAAGDLDVVARAEKMMQFKQDWPVMQATPIAGAFLMDYIKLAYPENAPNYAQILMQAQQQQTAVQQLAMIADGLLKDAIAGTRPTLQEAQQAEAIIKSALGNQGQPQSHPQM